MTNLTEQAREFVEDYENEKTTRKYLNDQPLGWRIAVILFAAIRLVTLPVLYFVIFAIEVVCTINTQRDKRKQFARIMLLNAVPYQIRYAVWTNLDVLTYGSFNYIQEKALQEAKNYYNAVVELQKL